jgi:hypothetical protein
MKRFIVIESNDNEFIGEFFEIETQIRNHVTLPFTNEEYRCVMYNGIDVQLVHDEKIIVGTLR